MGDFFLKKIFLIANLCPTFYIPKSPHSSCHEQKKIIDLLSLLPYSFKSKIVALLSKTLAEEVIDQDTAFVEEDLQTSKDFRKAINIGEMKLLSEEEYWSKLSSK